MRTRFLLSLALLTAIVGCSNAVPKAELFPVKGRVTLKGQPLTGCTLILIPVKPTPGVDDGYSGVLNEKGEFELASMSGKAGAAAGRYKVTFSTATADPSSEASRNAAMEAMKTGAYSPGGPKAPPYPKEFANFKTSTKEVEITREANELLIAL